MPFVGCSGRLVSSPRPSWRRRQHGRRGSTRSCGGSRRCDSSRRRRGVTRAHRACAERPLLRRSWWVPRGTLLLARQNAPGPQIDIVDEQNRVVGQSVRRLMRRDNLRHRATYIAVHSPTCGRTRSACKQKRCAAHTRCTRAHARSGELFVHKRTAVKDYCPSHWDPMPGGVVGAGETYREVCVALGRMRPRFHTASLSVYTFGGRRAERRARAVGGVRAGPGARAHRALLHGAARGPPIQGMGRRLELHVSRVRRLATSRPACWLRALNWRHTGHALRAGA